MLIFLISFSLTVQLAWLGRSAIMNAFTTTDTSSASSVSKVAVSITYRKSTHNQYTGWLAISGLKVDLSHKFVAIWSVCRQMTSLGFANIQQVTLLDRLIRLNFYWTFEVELSNESSDWFCWVHNNYFHATRQCFFLTLAKHWRTNVI